MIFQEKESKLDLFNEFSHEFESFVWLEHFGFQKSLLKKAIDAEKFDVFKCQQCKEIYIVNRSNGQAFNPLGDKLFVSPNNMQQKICQKCMDKPE